MPRKLDPAVLQELARSTEAQRPLAARLVISDNTVKRVRAKLHAAGLRGDTATPEQVQAAVYTPPRAIEPLRALPDYARIVEQRASGLSVLDCSRIYKRDNPSSYNHSRFAELVAKNVHVPDAYVAVHGPIAVPVNPYCERIHYKPLPEETSECPNPFDGVLSLDGDGWKLCARYGDLQAINADTSYRFMKATHKLTAIVIDGMAMLTTPALEWCLSQRIDVFVSTRVGWVIVAPARNHATLRRAQHTADRLRLAKHIVVAKLAACGEDPSDAASDVRRLTTIEALRIVEAQHALAYCRRLSPLELRGFATWPTAWGVWDGVRASALSHENNRATHPVNAMLNYAYSIAACKLEIAAMAKGLDVTCWKSTRNRQGACL